MFQTPEQNATTVSLIRQDIDSYCLKAFEQERRTHLGASEIGEECLRRLWYNWRWMVKKHFNARMLRLFNRGHKEELRFVQWLRGAGFTVLEIDERTGKQFTFSELGGHYGGGTDGVATHSVHFPNEWLSLEFKTHNKKQFDKLLKNGVKKSHPKHFAQISEYGAKFKLARGLYCATCKDSDDLHIELLDLDWSLAAELDEKARQIITAQLPPLRIRGASPSFYMCKDCEALAVCHYNTVPDKNCRSCIHAWPTENAEWQCNRWQAVIPKDVIPVGCSQYQAIG